MSTRGSPTAARAETAGVAAGGVRLALPLTIGPHAAEVGLEPGHCEWLFRIAAYAAVRDGLAGMGERTAARLVPGRVRDRHGGVVCLETCAVELLDGRGRVAARVEFPRRVFAAFAAVRAVHLLVGGGSAGMPSLAYSLHAAGRDEVPFPVDVPRFPRMSVAALAAEAAAHGTPDGDWMATFVAADVAAGLDEIDRLSRASGVEGAGWIDARVGFDAERRCFVRVLDRVVISRATRATATTVVSTAASWGEFLGTLSGAAPRSVSSLHTHLHLSGLDRGDGVPGDDLLAARDALRADGDPCISIEDVVTHLTTFSDPLSAAVIVSLFPGRRVVTLYGYTPGGQLREEPGYWTLPRTGGGTCGAAAPRRST